MHIMGGGGGLNMGWVSNGQSINHRGAVSVLHTMHIFSSLALVSTPSQSLFFPPYTHTHTHTHKQIHEFCCTFDNDDC